MARGARMWSRVGRDVEYATVGRCGVATLGQCVEVRGPNTSHRIDFGIAFVIRTMACYVRVWRFGGVTGAVAVVGCGRVANSGVMTRPMT